ncbi:uncharacterized protein [Chelonus insularis]|uniref:uncharacterized protein n=1 Tax=Chelonus insularis TaxID=460826 RepID=UPI00158A5D33|nr:uncharacterized protein LOC118064640 [Chelonus insularis]
MGDFILERVNSNEKILLKRDETYTYGREKNNEIVRVSPLISRKHCVFIVTASSVKIIDSGSSNGVFLNGNQIHPHTPTHVKVNDTIGIACGELQNILPDTFVYKLKRLENEAPHKRKLKTECSEIPSKIPKVEPIDSPEIVIIDDDDTPVMKNAPSKIPPNESNVIHPSVIKEDKNVVNNNSDMEIELINLDDLEPIENDVSTTNEQNNQTISINKIPQKIVSSSFPKPEFIPTNVATYQNMAENEFDPLEATVNFHFIKCESTLPESPDMFDELSSQPSTSNIKQEVTSSDLDCYNDNYSQGELICLSDDEEEKEINFPRSQLFDEIIISDEVHNDNITSIKQESATDFEELVDPYGELDDIPLIELTDDENEDDHDENTKAWLHKLLGSQLENQVQITVQPPKEEEEQQQREFIVEELEDSEEEQERRQEVKYGQLNDVTGNEIHKQNVVDVSYFMQAIGKLVDEIKEIEQKSEDEDNQISSDILEISGNENNVTEIPKKIIDSHVSNKSDTIQDKFMKSYSTLNDEKFKNKELTKKKKEKSLKKRNKQKSIKQSKSTSNKASNEQMTENLDDVSNKISEKDTKCHDTNIDNSFHKTVEPDQHTSMNICDSHSEAKSYSVLTDHKYTKLHKEAEDKCMKVNETNIDRIQQVNLHDKKISKEEKKINKKSKDSRKNSSEEIDVNLNQSLLSHEERGDSEAMEALKVTSTSEKTDNTIDKKGIPKIGNCPIIFNKRGKKIEQVDPPFLPKGERCGVSINITASTSGNIKDHSENSDDDIFTSNKTAIASRKKENKQTESNNLNKKEKRLERLRRKFGDYTSLNKNQKFSNEQKRKIKEERNERLKQLQHKSDEMKKSEQKTDINKRINKPKVKISNKNRGAFLTPDEISNDNIGKESSNNSSVERLIVPKIQELQQNTAAQDLYDVISSTSVSYSDDKSPKSENKFKQRIDAKENNNEIEKMDIDKEAAMEERKNKQISSENDNVDKTKPIITSNVSVNLPNIKCYKEQCDTNKIIQPLRGILRDLQNKKTVKKKVRFNDKTKIQVYLIDEGNKIEMKCTQKDMKIGKKFLEYDLSKAKVDCPKVELFLFKVFQWRPVWLNEQRDRQIPPPIVDGADISSVSLTYSSYMHYYKTMSTLMLLETWYIMSKDYETLKKRPVLYSSVVEQSVSQIVVDSSSDMKITTFMIEALITEKDLRQKHYPVYGDLVMLELAGIQDGKTIYTHVFAYITTLNYTTIIPSTRYNTALNKLIKNPHTLITYTMMTKALPFVPQTLKPGRLKTVIYFRSYMRMVQALHYLPQSPLLNAILHPTPEAYKLPFVSHYESLTLVTKDMLNRKQRESVFRIAEAVHNQKPGIFLIQGPPGTGKSKVIINLITEILYGRKKNENQKFMKILVCAPSNAAIDEIVSRLKVIRSNVEDPAYKFKMVRIGRLEAVSPAVRSFHVSELAKRDVEKTLTDYHAAKNSSESIEKQKEYLLAHINALKEECNAEDMTEMQRQHLSRKLASFRAKYELFSNYNPSAPINSKLRAKIHQAAENTILAGANIIACTLSSCYTNQMESIFGKSNGKISVCIVDEATQSSEPETLIPLMLGVTSLVLVGDPNQLPATIISQQAKHLGFDKSLFARIHSVFDGNPHNPIIMLDTQYRMSDRIMLFPNRYFYNNAIQNVSPRERLPFHFYKVFNLSSHQDDSNKFSNTDEATFVANLIYTMAINSHRIKNLGIGIITPYNDQRILINQKIIDRMENVPEEIKKKIITEVNTVDSFQGQERDVVIMSCVRSNGIGFLSDRQRLCVALTRAKFSLVLCGNFKTFEKDPMWFELLKDARDRNIYINLDYKAEPEKIKEFIIR